MASLSHIIFSTNMLFKYLYLLFGDDNVFPLDQWVFNTNGHPLPVKGTPRYQHINNNPTTFHSLTVKEIKEGDIIKRIQPPRRPVPNKRTLDSLIRQKLAVRNVSRKQRRLCYIKIGFGLNVIFIFLSFGFLLNLFFTLSLKGSIL